MKNKLPVLVLACAFVLLAAIAIYGHSTVAHLRHWVIFTIAAAAVLTPAAVLFLTRARIKHGA